MEKAKQSKTAAWHIHLSVSIPFFVFMFAGPIYVRADSSDNPPPIEIKVNTFGWDEFCGTDRLPGFEDPSLVPYLHLEGSWILKEYEDGRLIGVRHISLHKGRDLVLSPFYISSRADRLSGPWRSLLSWGWRIDKYGKRNEYSPNSSSVTVESNGTVRLSLGEQVTLHQEGSGRMSGQWTEDDNWTKTHRKGKATLQKVIPKIKSIIFIGDETDTVAFGERSGRLVVEYQGHSATRMRGNRRRVNIQVFGENLWGSHHLWIDPIHHLEISGSHIKGDPVFHNGVRDDNKGVSIGLVTWPEMFPGKKVLWFDDIAIPFELVLTKYLKKEDIPKRPELVSLEALGARDVVLSELEEQAPFLLQAVFKEDHPDVWVKAKLPAFGNITQSGDSVNEDAEAKKQVVLWRTNDARVFRSKPLLLTGSSLKEQEDNPLSLPKGIDQNKTRQVLAEHFSGTWAAVLGPKIMDDRASALFLRGTAEVDFDGTSISMSLETPDGHAYYESQETDAVIYPKEERAPFSGSLSVRFKRIAAPGAIESLKGGLVKDAIVLVIPRDNKSVVFELEKTGLRLPVIWDEHDLDRLTVKLYSRGNKDRLKGPWSQEIGKELKGGGNASWIRGDPWIKNVIIVNNQLDASEGTACPYRPDGTVIPSLLRKRTLVVYGKNLPYMADEADIRSLSAAIDYDPDYKTGIDRQSVIDRAFKKAGVENPEQYDALIVHARLNNGIMSGVKLLSVNGASGVWPLLFASQHAMFRFVREREVTMTFYQGDAGAVEMVIEPQLQYKPFAIEILTQDKFKRSEPITIGTLLARQTEEEHSYFTYYRTDPIHFLNEDNDIQRPPDDDSALPVPVKDGDIIIARLLDPAQMITIPYEARARAVAEPNELGRLWKNALDRVAKCSNTTVEDYEEFQHETAKTVSKVILTSLKNNDITLKNGDHAAAILIYDQYKRASKAALEHFEALYQNRPGLRRFRDQAKKIPAMAAQPFWHSMKATHVKKRRFWFDKETEIPLVDTLDDEAIARKFKMTPAEAEIWGYNQTVKAVGEQIKKTRKAIETAELTPDKSLDKLLVVAGHKSESLIALILPHLVKKEVKRGPPRREYWVNDQVAQGYVKGLHIAGGAVRALEEYSSIDSDVAAAVAAIATFGLSAGLEAGGYAGAAMYTALTADVVDLAIGAFGVAEYLEGEELYELAQGAAPVVGNDFLEYAESKRTSGTMAAVGVLMPGISGATGLNSLRHFKNVQRGKGLFREGEDLLSDFKNLPDQEQKAVAGYFKDLMDRARKSDLESFDEVDLKAYGQFENYLAELGESLPLPVPNSLGSGSARALNRVDEELTHHGSILNDRLTEAKAKLAKAGNEPPRELKLAVDDLEQRQQILKNLRKLESDHPDALTRMSEDDVKFLLDPESTLTPAQIDSVRKNVLEKYETWPEITKAFSKGEISELDMHQLVSYRQQEVDKILDTAMDNVRNQEIEKLRKAGVANPEQLVPKLESKAYGSTNLTSDYDLSVSGHYAEQVPEEFNKLFRERFGDLGGLESGTQFDTNVYTDAAYALFKGDDAPYKDMNLGGTKLDDMRQLIYDQMATRKYLSDEQWVAHKEMMVRDQPEDMRNMLEEVMNNADHAHQQGQKVLARHQMILEGTGQATGSAENIALKAQNNAYAEELQNIGMFRTEMRRLNDMDGTGNLPANPEFIRRFGMGGYKDNLDLLAKLKQDGKLDEVKKLQDKWNERFAGIIRDRQGNSLYYANEACQTEGAINHVVGELQKAKKPVTLKTLTAARDMKRKGRLSDGQYLNSFFENRANMFKELNHVRQAAKVDESKMAAKATKYFTRQLDAAHEAGIDLTDLFSKDTELQNIMELTLAAEKVRGSSKAVTKVLEASNVTPGNYVSRVEKASHLMARRGLDKESMQSLGKLHGDAFRKVR